MVACRELLELRLQHGGGTVFVHVHSHTEGSDWPSLGNAAADIVAGEAASDTGFQDERDTPFLGCEEDFVFWVRKGEQDFHVSGDLRSTLKSQAMSSLVSSLQSLGTQGAVAREAGMALLGRFDAVRKARDSDLLLFLLLAAVR